MLSASLKKKLQRSPFIAYGYVGGGGGAGGGKKWNG